MRRSLALLSLATTTLVVIALLVPLGLLVRRQAHDAARLGGERDARTTAALVALALSFDTPSAQMQATVGPLPPGVIISTSDGTRIGGEAPGQGTLVDPAMDLQGTISGIVPGGWEMALPVIGRDRVAVVDVFIPDSRLEAGVTEAWLLLALLGVGLIALAVFVADRLGRRLVAPVRSLATAAHRLGDGDLDVRVEVEDRTELREVASAFNALASRLGQLLAEAREEAADLSHRLRTPVTSLRLQAETLADPEERRAVVSQIDRLESSIDAVITAARAKAAEVGASRLDATVAARAAFWSALADEQGRTMTVDLASGAVVAVAASQLEDIVDILVDNVFSHTAPGVAFEVATGMADAGPWLRISDNGEGIESSSVVERGVSGTGSTGLGLDIVRRVAESTGGGLDLATRPGGGTQATVRFGSFRAGPARG